MAPPGNGNQPLDEAAWLAAIVESSDEAIISTDLEGKLTSWNPSAERIYGYSAMEAIGQRNELIIPPDRRGEEERIRQSVLVGQSVSRYDTVRVRKDGVRIDVSIAGSPLRDRGGKIVGISKISCDISDEKQIGRVRDESAATARRLAAIVESSDDAIIGLDLEGNITAWNLAAAQMCGYTADEAIGRSIAITLPHERAPEEPGFLERIGRGERIVGFETIRCRKGGQCLPVSLTISPIYDEQGAVVGASKIARDITERKRAAERSAFLTEAGAVLASSLEYETTLKAGKYKDTLSPFRALQDTDREEIQIISDDIYGQFVKAVAEGRGLPEAKVREIAEGRIYTGHKAKELKLVDEMGGVDDAVAAAWQLAGQTGEPKVQYPPKDRELSLRDYVLLGAPELVAIEQELAALEQQMADGAHGQATLDRYARAQARLEHAGGYGCCGGVPWTSRSTWRSARACPAAAPWRRGACCTAGRAGRSPSCSSRPAPSRSAPRCTGSPRPGRSSSPGMTGRRGCGPARGADRCGTG